MAIVTETATFRGREFLHSYSDSGYKIERDGVAYDDAMDPLDSGREYVETDELVESVEEAEETEAV